MILIIIISHFIYANKWSYNKYLRNFKKLFIFNKNSIHTYMYYDIDLFSIKIKNIFEHCAGL